MGIYTSQEQLNNFLIQNNNIHHIFCAKLKVITCLLPNSNPVVKKNGLVTNFSAGLAHTLVNSYVQTINLR